MTRLPGLHEQAGDVPGDAREHGVGGAELELPLVEPVVLALELELGPGSSIAAGHRP